MSLKVSIKQLVVDAPGALASALSIPVSSIVHGEARPGLDLVLEAEGRTFAVVVPSTGSGAVEARASQAVAHAKRVRRGVPLVLAPFMAPAARAACERAESSWLDLSGNAHIVAPGLRVIISGRPNQFLTPGRPPSLFAPRSARITRWLLTHYPDACTQRALARATGLTEGLVSRVVAGLEAERLVARVEPHEMPGLGFGVGTGSGSGGGGGEGAGFGGSFRHKPPLHVRDPRLLLEAWREQSRFDRHELLVGHIAARSGESLTRFVSETLAASQVAHAATGLAAAWQMTHFAVFRLSTFFIASPLSREVKARLGLREDPRGANVWLAVPNDEGVFDQASEREGVRCVHPVQAYVDLKGHPERAAEAAQRLAVECMPWSRHD